MIILGYVGNHAKDTFLVRLGWAVTRLVQKGKFKQITHTECIHAGVNYKYCTIASSSIRDGGVRTKENISLTKGNWVAFDVPAFAIERSAAWFDLHAGLGYDWVGAAGTKLTFLRKLAYSINRFFCNEACLAAFSMRAAEFTPSEFFEHLVDFYGATDVTDQFFKD
jgi:hypothetical protein